MTIIAANDVEFDEDIKDQLGLRAKEETRMKEASTTTKNTTMVAGEK